jgi:hypothetical protein
VRLIEPRRPLLLWPSEATNATSPSSSSRQKACSARGRVGTECRVAVRAQEAALLDERSRDPEVGL